MNFALRRTSNMGRYDNCSREGAPTHIWVLFNETSSDIDLLESIAGIFFSKVTRIVLCWNSPNTPCRSHKVIPFFVWIGAVYIYRPDPLRYELQARKEDHIPEESAHFTSAKTGYINVTGHSRFEVYSCGIVCVGFPDEDG